MKVEDLQTYRLIRKERIEEINSEGFVLEHRKTGARIFLVSNDDSNKVFTIGFRTPPYDSTGVPHIMEHSVLCGSEKFPVKDPFVELVKGSLNTFLNAMTYPDKTVYPVASCNDSDFQNLMDVYMDAVLHPNIYREEKIFRQEGWHYEASSREDDITINGVVYNEMKGAFSSPESVLDRCIQNTLFPDNCYGVESGGDPKVIPELTYEAFLDFHRKYYHPSNSFIYLYGDMDMAEKLRWLDEAYLSAYDRLEVDSEIVPQKPFEAPAEKEIFYSVTDEEETSRAAYLSWNAVCGDGPDAKRNIAFQILDYILLDAPGAVLKRALVEAGIGEDVSGGFENGILQPYFTVVAKNAEEGQKEEFLRVVRETLTKLSEEGISRKFLRAGINSLEFRLREADFGNYPKGLMYGLQCFDSWLYGGDPMLYMRYREPLDFIRSAAEEGYFEKLIREMLLDNPFSAVIVVRPKPNLTAEDDRALADKLRAMKERMSPDDLDRLIRATEELKKYQDEPSAKEDLEKIPLLKRSDIRREAEKLPLSVREVSGTTVLGHELFTSGILYLRLMFETDRIPPEDLPYAGLLKSVLAYIDTEHYTMEELSDEIDLDTGGIGTGMDTYVDFRRPDEFRGFFDLTLRVFGDRLEKGLSLAEEILLRSKLSDTKRLKEIIDEVKSRKQLQLNTASHQAAVRRAMSYFAADKAYEERTAGIAFYDFLCGLSENFEEKKDGISERLRDVAAKLFTAENLTVSCTAGKEDLALLEEKLAGFKKALPEGDGRTWYFRWEKGNRNEGFKAASQVNYVARCGRLTDRDHGYTAALKLLKVILGYDYLWLNVRVKGGAYGVMTGTGRSGQGYFVSYRDPKLPETNAVFESVPDYLEQFDADERAMTKFVIGTMSEVDAPLLPQYRGTRADSAYFSGVTAEMLQTERDEILDAQPEDIRALAPCVRNIMEEGSFCVIGNAEAIEKYREMFCEVRNLF